MTAVFVWCFVILFRWRCLSFLCQYVKLSFCRVFVLQGLFFRFFERSLRLLSISRRICSVWSHMDCKHECCCFTVYDGVYQGTLSSFARFSASLSVGFSGGIIAFRRSAEMTGGQASRNGLGMMAWVLWSRNFMVRLGFSILIWLLFWWYMGTS